MPAPRKYKYYRVSDRIYKASWENDASVLDKLTPRTPLENVKWRQFVTGEAGKSRDLRRAFRWAIRQSLYFWLDSFVWSYDPRRVATNPMTPWVTRPVQRPFFDLLRKSVLEQHDLGIEKSRDEGASWGCLLTFLHFWLTRDKLDFLMVSRAAALVDSSDPISLFWKIDYALARMPSWIIDPSAFRRTEMCLRNHENGSVITGATTTGQAGVGGRKTAMFMDEFPLIEDAEEMWHSSQSTTGCRIVNGTHTGTGSMFYRVLNEYPVWKAMLGWWENPEKNQGWEKRRNKRDIRGWSPWYQKECERLGNNKQQIAAMLNVDPHGSSFLFFDADEIARLADAFCVDPDQEGDLSDGKFVPAEDGPLKLWVPVSPGRRPALGQYVIGADVATGSQGKDGTPSCAAVFDAETGQKVAEYASAVILTEKYGDLLVELAKWFWNAKVCWESAGPGSTIRLRFVDAGYTNVYYRRNEKSVFNPVEKDEMGWTGRPDDKRDALVEYRRALSAGECLNRSRVALLECLNFVETPRGVEHSLTRATNDPSGAKANHSDRVIADMLAWKLVAERGLVNQKTAKPVPELAQNSLAWRMAQWREQQAEYGEVVEEWGVLR